MSMRGLVTALALTAVGACGSDPAIVVEVTGRPAMLEATSLEVTLANEGATQTETFDLSGKTLPTTFSITAPGRTGAIVITARALAGEVEVGRGVATVDAKADAGVLTLDPSDFVVNTEFAGGQFLNQDIETNGFQLTAHADVVTFGFRDDCPVSVCNQLGRRFGADGRPLSTELGAGTNQFRWNQNDGAFVAHVAVASQADGGSIALWDTPTGVSCRSMTADGVAAPSEITLAPDTGADVVSAVPFPDGSYGVVWAADDINGIQVIRSTVISPTCTTRVSPFTVAGPISFANRPTIAENASATMVAWIENFDTARFRVGTAAGVFTPTGTTQIGGVLVTVPAPDGVDFVRLVALSTGFGVVYTRRGVDADSLWFRRTETNGAQRGSDTLIADDIDFAAPAVAFRQADGAIGIAWTRCDDSDGSGCGVFARLVRPSGVPVGDEFLVNTTTRSNQTDPSIAALSDGFVIAFTDDSTDPPDVSELGVRARFTYPRYDSSRGVIGASCGSTADCVDPGLVCAEDGEAALLCHLTCDPGAGPAACPAGGACIDNGPESYCQY